MTYGWTDTKPVRPDRYVDWELQARKSTAKGDRWCSVLIEVKEDHVLDRLRHLQAMVEAGRDNSKLRMSVHELSRLRAAISEFNDNIDAVGRRYFVYVPESELYENGLFQRKDDYTIRYVSPPIESYQSSERSEGDALAKTWRVSKASAGQYAVAIAVIDDGIAFAHEHFRRADGSSRVRAVWLQDIETFGADGIVTLGRRIDGDQISGWLKDGLDEVDIYRRSEVGELDFSLPAHRAVAYRRAHGTHVMDLACGDDPADVVRDNRAIFAVQLPSRVTSDTSGTHLASYVLQGVRAVMAWADDLDPKMPLVINFSYGFAAGPKDGTHIIENELDLLVRCRVQRGAPTFIVLPSGNNYLSRLTARMNFSAPSRQEIEWIILPDDQTENFLEIWTRTEACADSDSPIDLVLALPDGTAEPIKAPIEPGCLRIVHRNQQPIAGIYSDVFRDDNGGVRWRHFIAVNRTADLSGTRVTAPSGAWTISVQPRATQECEVKLYIQRDDTPSGYRMRGRQSYFEHPKSHERDPASGAYTSWDLEQCPITHVDTLTAIGNGGATVLVGAARDLATYPPSDYTASGPTVARRGPDLAGVSDDTRLASGILAAGTRSGSRVAMGGTSVAAPQVARAIAEVLSTQGAMGSTRAPHNQCYDRLAKAVLAALPTIPLHGECCSASGNPLRARLGCAVLPKVKSARFPPRKYT